MRSKGASKGTTAAVAAVVAAAAATGAGGRLLKAAGELLEAAVAAAVWIDMSVMRGPGRPKRTIQLSSLCSQRPVVSSADRMAQAGGGTEAKVSCELPLSHPCTDRAFAS